MRCDGLKALEIDFVPLLAPETVIGIGLMALILVDHALSLATTSSNSYTKPSSSSIFPSFFPNRLLFLGYLA